ncbi:MAG: hypothetical protein R3362_02210 [Rhodothermales bacterium]|nr:hypothetical protein [Rhodothermales bacterium]
MIPRSLCTLLLFALAGLSASDALAQERAVRTIRSWEAPVKVDGRTEMHRVEMAFDYDRGVTIRRVYGPGGDLLEEREVAGQPAPNAEELAAARDLVAADPVLSDLLADTGATIEGGFLYNGDTVPACGPTSRCLQFDLIGPSRAESVRFVVVDLTTGEVVERDLHPGL